MIRLIWALSSRLHIRCIRFDALLIVLVEHTRWFCKVCRLPQYSLAFGSFVVGWCANELFMQGLDHRRFRMVAGWTCNRYHRWHSSDTVSGLVLRTYGCAGLWMLKRWLFSATAASWSFVHVLDYIDTVLRLREDMAAQRVALLLFFRSPAWIILVARR